MTHNILDTLTKEYINKLDMLRLKMNTKANSGYNGIRKSDSKGSSLEFSDFRDYAQGDDIRRIDWNSYGRFDKLFIKLFSEEKQSSVNIFLDKSKSMDFGGVNKSYYSKLFAASVAYLTLKSADKLNIFACDEKIGFEKTNVSSKDLFPSIVRFLNEIEPSGKTSLTKSILGIKGLNIGSGISFILSDFFSLDGYEEAVKLLQSKKQQVILVHIMSRDEISPALADGLRLYDSETKANIDLYINADILNKYKEALNSYHDEIAAFCKKRNAHYIFTPTDNHVLKVISQNLL